MLQRLFIVVVFIIIIIIIIIILIKINEITVINYKTIFVTTESTKCKVSRLITINRSPCLSVCLSVCLPVCLSVSVYLLGLQTSFGLQGSLPHVVCS